MKTASAFRNTVVLLIFILQTVGFLFAGPESVLPVEQAMRRLEAQCYWEPISGRAVISSSRGQLSFFPSNTNTSTIGLLDGHSLLILPAVQSGPNGLQFPVSFIEAIEKEWSRQEEDRASRFRIAAIIIDAGHGGKDPGAVASHVFDGKKLTLQEKDIVLTVARDVHQRLTHTYPDKLLLMTRDADVFLSLEERVRKANSIQVKENEAILFISIHANASFNKNARGFEVWYLSPEYRRTVLRSEQFEGTKEVFSIINEMMEEEITNESILISKHILQRFIEVAADRSPSRGLKAAEWFVVRNAHMPSVLIELGFLTNSSDAVLLNDEMYLRQLGGAIYNGLVDFVSTFEKSGGFTAAR